ncbi:MAG: hypothetical protein JWP31_765 [Aeromicrobium sp.]|nr:hypothetical protein [Aeromicrobium sp.]
MPEIVTTSRGTGLVWGLKDSFVSYARRAGARVELGGGAGQLPGSAEFYFPLTHAAEFDGTGLVGTLRFGGQLRVVAHRGMLDVGVFDPWLTVRGRRGTLSVRDRSTGTPADARMDLVEVVLPVPTCDGSTLMWSSAPTTLAPAGALVFDGNYVTGEDFARLSVRVPWVGAQDGVAPSGVAPSLRVGPGP